MLRFQAILHPTDFSSGSAEAFRYACAVARDCGARLIVLHALEPAPAMAGEAALVPFELEESRQLAQTSMDDIHVSDPAISLEKVVREGAAPSVILDVADEFDVDLIVMGTHGRTGLRRLFLGSVAELVLRRAHCPILTVKESVHLDHVENEQFEAAGKR